MMQQKPSEKVRELVDRDLHGVVLTPAELALRKIEALASVVDSLVDDVSSEVDDRVGRSQTWVKACIDDIDSRRSHEEKVTRAHIADLRAVLDAANGSPLTEEDVKLFIQIAAACAGKPGHLQEALHRNGFRIVMAPR